MSREPTNLTDALASFDQPWSPRIVTTVNDYDVRIAEFAGEHVWHAHDDTDVPGQVDATTGHALPERPRA